MRAAPRSASRLAAQDDVPLEAERPLLLGRLESKRADHPLGAPRVGSRDRVEDRVLEEQRVAREVHLRHQPLRERAAEEAEVDVRGPPRVGVVAPRVGARADRDEAEVALVVGQAVRPAPREVRVERRRPVVPAVAVAPAGVGLPDLDERVAAPARPSSSLTRPWTMIRWPSGSPSCWRVRSWSSAPSAVLAEHRRGQLGQPLRERDQRLLRVPQRASTCSPGSRAGMRGVVSDVTRLQHHGEALADADADRRDAVPPPRRLQLVGERAEDARRRTRRAGGRCAIAPPLTLTLLGVELRPLADAGERLRRERLVELDDVDVAPADPGALERAVGGLDRADAEDVGVDGERAAAGDPRDRSRPAAAPASRPISTRGRRRR